MKNKRNMVYSDYNAGAFIDPQMGGNTGMISGPQGYMMSGNYQAFGPNVVPNEMPYKNNFVESDYEARITKLERQIRNLDTRLSKLENSSTIEDDITFNSSNYMI